MCQVPNNFFVSFQTEDELKTHLMCFKVYYMYIWLCFSSPEHKVLKESFCDGPLFVVRPCVNNFFKLLLLWNHPLGFDQTAQEGSLGGPLPKLFKPFQLVA